MLKSFFGIRHHPPRSMASRKQEVIALLPVAIEYNMRGRWSASRQARILMHHHVLGDIRFCRKSEVRSPGPPPGTQPPCMQFFLLPDGANFRERCRPECADLRRPSGLSFGQEVDKPAFAHIALHA
jgi:hypothetical protein